MMSRPLPWGMPSMMSMRTTSPSSRSASRCASVAPTFPAPTTVIFLFIVPSVPFSVSSVPLWRCCRCRSRSLQLRDDPVRERGRLHLGRSLHPAGEIVGDLLAGDLLLERRLDGVRRLAPAQVAEHHAAGQD